MKAFLCGALISIAVSLQAADIKYPVAEIPDALKKNVGAVVRHDDRSITIANQRSLVFYGHCATTILSGAGNEHASIVVG